MTLTFEAAQSVRDGVIDAVAALDNALCDALRSLSPTDYAALKRSVARAISVIFEELHDPAIQSCPELKAGEADWTSIAQAQAAKRASPR